MPTISQAPKLAATLLLGLVFAAAAAAPATRRLSRAGAIAAFVVLTALLAVEATMNLPLSRAAQPGAELWVIEGNPAKGVTILLGLGWAIAAGALADERPRLALATLAACGACATQFGQAANFAAFGLGLGAFALALIAPRFALMAISAALAAWMLAAPFVTPLLAHSSLVERLPFKSRPPRRHLGFRLAADRGGAVDRPRPRRLARGDRHDRGARPDRQRGAAASP